MHCLTTQYFTGKCDLRIHLGVIFRNQPVSYLGFESMSRIVDFSNFNWYQIPKICRCYFNSSTCTLIVRWVNYYVIFACPGIIDIIDICYIVIK